MQKKLFLISMKSKVKIPTVNLICHQCLPFPQPTNSSESVRTVTFFKVGTLLFNKQKWRPWKKQCWLWSRLWWFQYIKFLRSVLLALIIWCKNHCHLVLYKQIDNNGHEKAMLIMKIMITIVIKIMKLQISNFKFQILT